MAFTAEQIRSAVESSLAQGFNMDQVYQGAKANFGLSKAAVDSALALNTDFNNLNFDFVQEESGGYYAPVYLDNGTTVYRSEGGIYEVTTPSLGATYDNQGNLLNTYEYTGPKTGIIYDPQGNVVGNINSGSRLNQVLSDVFKPLSPAIPAILGSLVLGPAGSGLLSGTAAAAASSGANSLFQGGSLTDALKAAAVGGAAAYGLGELFPSGAADVGAQQALDLTVVDDIGLLANQGLSNSQVADIISAGYGIEPVVAAESVANTLGSLAASPSVVTITGDSLGALSGIAPSLSAVVPSILPQVTVTGQNFQTGGTEFTAPEVPISAAVPTVLGGNIQQVNVESNRLPTQTDNTSSIAAAVGGIVPGIQPAIPTAADKVEVTGQRVNNNNTIDTSGIAAALPGLAPGLTQPLPKATDTTKKNDKTTTDLINNALKLIGLVAGGGAAAKAGSGTGTGTGSVPVSNPLNYDDDYYKRIQKYYDQYMPNYPRDVATPLREWYGSGSMGTSGGPTGTSGGMAAPGSVFNTLFTDLGLNKEN